MNTQDKVVATMLRCNPFPLVEAVVEAVVNQHNAKPQVASQEFLEAIVRAKPEMLKPIE
jgi:hypothetical protein